jgi:NifB/MoaA-like Fe-S oxidoreductase
VRFGFEQRWTATVDEVLEVYLDPDFWAGLEQLAKTSPPEVLGLERAGDRAVVRLRYRLSVELPSEAARFIDPEDVAWVEETTWDLRARRAEVRFLPVQAAALMRASATAVLLDDGAEAAREVRGEVRVRIPLLGGRVEKAVVEGVGQHLEEEADAVADRLGTD